MGNKDLLSDRHKLEEFDDGRRPEAAALRPLTVRGAAGGPVAGAVAHLDPLPAHLQQARVRDASPAGVAETLLVVAAVVRDVDGRPRSPRCGLL